MFGEAPESLHCTERSGRGLQPRDSGINGDPTLIAEKDSVTRAPSDGRGWEKGHFKRTASKYSPLPPA
jgi:hypothetical protein